MAQEIKGVSNLDYKNFLIVGCPRSGSDSYSTTTGIDVSAVDYAPDIPMLGLHLTGGAGNIAIEMVNKGRMVLPFSVITGDSREVLRGHKIQKVLSSGTTFTGDIFPVA